jgi:hypothetical protein
MNTRDKSKEVVKERNNWIRRLLQRGEEVERKGENDYNRMNK